MYAGVTEMRRGAFKSGTDDNKAFLSRTSDTDSVATAHAAPMGRWGGAFRSGKDRELLLS